MIFEDIHSFSISRMVLKKLFGYIMNHVHHGQTMVQVTQVIQVLILIALLLHSLIKD